MTLVFRVGEMSCFSNVLKFKMRFSVHNHEQLAKIVVCSRQFCTLENKKEKKKLRHFQIQQQGKINDTATVKKEMCFISRYKTFRECVSRDFLPFLIRELNPRCPVFAGCRTRRSLNSLALEFIQN